MGTEFSDIVISGRFVECLAYLGIGIVYGILITMVINYRKRAK